MSPTLMSRCLARRFRSLILVSVLCLPGMPAHACSYDGMPLDLSLAHPASLSVALAAQQAYQEKLMPRPLPLPGGFGMRRTLGLLEKLQQRLPVGAPGFSLLLVEPGLWSRFTADGVRLHAIPAPGELQVIVSEGALLALESGKISTADAMQLGLLIIDGPSAKVLAEQAGRVYPGG